MTYIADMFRHRRQPPADRWVSLTVFGPAPETIDARLKPDLGDVEIRAVREGDTRHFQFRVPSTLGGGADLIIAAEGWTPYRARLRQGGVDVALPVGDTELDAVTLTPLVVALPAVRVAGKFFELETGAPWTQIGCSDFRLFQRFLVGEDIGPILAQRAALGFNQLRVFGMCDWMFRLYPQEHADYVDWLRDFIALVERAGLRVEWTVFVDARRVMPIQEDQRRHYQRTTETLQAFSHMAFLELVNEVDQTINVIDTDAFSQPAGLIACHGSKGVVDAALEPVCVVPIWNYGTLHPSRPADWPRKTGHNAMEDVADRFGVPATVNETCRPNQGRGPIASDWFDAAASCALLTAGGTFHSEAGKQSALFEGDDLACAEAWVRGALAVPLTYRRGSYTAGHLSDAPFQHVHQLWAWARLLGHEACVVASQAPAGWLRPRNGWRIVSEQGSVTFMERR